MLNLLQNTYGTLHGGAVGVIAELVSLACARTFVAKDKDLFLGELSISYLAATGANVSLKQNFALLLPLIEILFELQNLIYWLLDFICSKLRLLQALCISPTFVILSQYFDSKFL